MTDREERGERIPGERKEQKEATVGFSQLGQEFGTASKWVMCQLWV